MVVFDVETKTLIDSATPVHDMAVSVACAVQIPNGCAHVSDAAVTRRTFWQRDGLPSGRRDGCETLENMFGCKFRRCKLDSSVQRQRF